MRAHQQFPKPPVQGADRALDDARVREAVACLVRKLKARPHPSWRFDDVARGRYNPYRVAFDMIDGAIAAGATEDDCWPMMTVVADHIARRFPKSVPELKPALLHETSVEGGANVALQRLMGEPTCQSALYEAEEKASLHIRALELVRDSIRATRRAVCGARRSTELTISR